MPNSNLPADKEDLALVEQALELNKKGIKARVSFEGDEQTPIGKVIDRGSIFYEDPNLPGKHIELDIIEGDVHSTVKEGSLDHRIALEEHLNKTGEYNPYGKFSGSYEPGYPPRDNPGSDADRFYKTLEKSKPLEEKYLSQIKALLQKGYRFM